MKSLSASQRCRRRTVRRDAVGEIVPDDRSSLSRGHGEDEREGVVCEVELPSKIQVILHAVIDWPIRRSELQVVTSLRPEETILELETPLVGEVGDGRSAAESEGRNESANCESSDGNGCGEVRRQSG